MAPLVSIDPWKRRAEAFAYVEAHMRNIKWWPADPEIMIEDVLKSLRAETTYEEGANDPLLIRAAVLSIFGAPRREDYLKK